MTCWIYIYIDNLFCIIHNRNSFRRERMEERKGPAFDCKKRNVTLRPSLGYLIYVTSISIR